MPKALWIAHVEVTDADAYGRYAALAGPPAPGPALQAIVQFWGEPDHYAMGQLAGQKAVEIILCLGRSSITPRGHADILPEGGPWTLGRPQPRAPSGAWPGSRGCCEWQ